MEIFNFKTNSTLITEKNNIKEKTYQYIVITLLEKGIWFKVNFFVVVNLKFNLKLLKICVCLLIYFLNANNILTLSMIHLSSWLTYSKKKKRKEKKTYHLINS